MEDKSPVLDINSSSSESTRRETADRGCYLPCRYALAILSCSGFCVLYLLRVNLSVALVAMVNSTDVDAKASSNNPECHRNITKADQYEGLHLGTILGMPLAGAVGVVWTIVWMMLTYDKPANHPRISIKEKEYIQSSIGSGQDIKIRVRLPFRFIQSCSSMV
ncbi:hypothetical protein OS493_030957 [Desmophyllum pertusum]|uniref:Uncharacterized protein n=1 Tax=Desmophyllum pertusum TaxID=174260 RepID=A0A9X0D170_9CNID|nr:hypothetical protein OS493_030957 [Desmophyllum pertusum]